MDSCESDLVSLASWRSESDESEKGGICARRLTASRLHTVSGIKSGTSKSTSESHILKGVTCYSKNIRKPRVSVKGVKRSELTPRMALYIPPHLQKLTQTAMQSQKGVITSAVALTPEQKRQEKELFEKFKCWSADYLLRQNYVHKCSEQTASRDTPLNAGREKIRRRFVPSKLWTTDMEMLLKLRNDSHEKFIVSGDKDELTESKKAKRKLRKYLRKVRSKITQRTKKKQLCNSELGESSESTNNSSENVITELVPIELNLSEDESVIERESVTDFIKSQKVLAREEWANTIVELYGRMKDVQSDVIKTETIDSEDDCTTTDGSPAGKIYTKTVDNSRKSSKSIQHNHLENATQDSLDAANNEYLNQQFLRRQHDYEREQRHRQLELNYEKRDAFLGSPENSIRDCDFHDEVSRLRSSTLHPSEIGPMPPLPPFPYAAMPYIKGYGRKQPEEPIEPFVGERRRIPLFPSGTSSKQDSSRSEKTYINQNVYHLEQRTSYCDRRSRSQSPRYNSNRSYQRDQRPFNGRVVQGRAVSMHVHTRGGPDERERLSPYSERIRRNEIPIIRALSPFSERMKSKVMKIVDHQKLGPFDQPHQSQSLAKSDGHLYKMKRPSKDGFSRVHSVCDDARHPKEYQTVSVNYRGRDVIYGDSLPKRTNYYEVRHERQLSPEGNCLLSSKGKSEVISCRSRKRSHDKASINKVAEKRPKIK